MKYRIIVLFFPLSIWYTFLSAQTSSDLEAANKLESQAAKLLLSGNYNDAIAAMEQALPLKEKSIGTGHPDLADSFEALAQLYAVAGFYAKAEEAFQRTVSIRETTLGELHPDVAQSLNLLSVLYVTTGRYAESEPLLRRALEIRTKFLGDNHPDTADVFTNLGVLYKETARYEEAEAAYEKALAIRQEIFSTDHPDVAESLSNLADVYRETGRFVESEIFNKRALLIRETILGPEHTHVVTSLNNLALLYDAMGRYAEAEPLYKRAIAIERKNSKNGSTTLASCLNNLGELYRETGQYAEAETLHKEALRISEAFLGKMHPDVAISLNNLAILYSQIWRFKEAEPLQQRAIAIIQRTLGDEHPLNATGLQVLAHIKSGLGYNEEAEPLFEKALALHDAKFGLKHPGRAQFLNELGLFYYFAGRYQEAETMHRLTLAIMETTGGEHPNTAKALTNLAYVLAANDKHENAGSLLHRASTIFRNFQQDVFPILSERQQLTFQIKYQTYIHTLVSHTAQYLIRDNKALEETINSWLQWKGAVQEVQANYRNAAILSGSPEITSTWGKLTNVRHALAGLWLTGHGKMPIEIYQQRVKELQNQKESLEADLGRLSVNFADEQVISDADVRSIAKSLSPESVYIDFANTKYFDFKQRRWSQSHYVAFLVIPGIEMRLELHDLGHAKPIEEAVASYLKAIRQRQDLQVLEGLNGKLYALLIEPLLSSLGTRKHLFIVPDGALNLMPLEVLQTPDGSYFGETHEINYLTSGRDILRWRNKRSGSAAVVIADPDYDLVSNQDQTIRANGEPPNNSFEQLTRSIKNFNVSRLPATRKEGEQVAKILRDDLKMTVETFFGNDAREEMLLSKESPIVLHIATHGYFLPDVSTFENIANSTPARVLIMEQTPVTGDDWENPMARSGILLAGANTSVREGDDYGIVSADKLLSLRLNGTELVVLSACETGVGDLLPGEGVFGLKRSFVLAGANTLIMSLWQVPDQETEELMIQFYQYWAAGFTKREALKKAQINIGKQYKHPYFWGAFILIGDPS